MLEDLGTDLICVLDGLDECADDSLASLLQKIKMLFSESLEKHKLRLIILSRRHPDCLERVLGSFARIDLDSDQVSNQPDINSYITSRIAQLAERKGISTSLVRHIEEIFREKSEDTFLWVSFMADDLEKQTVSGIEKALQTLPKGLDEIYERILLHIKPDNTTTIASMLQWISLALRPLTVPQLAESMRIRASGYLSKEELCLSYIESCGHLLQVSRPSGTNELSQESDLRVTFVHQSVKDFLFGLAKHHKISAFQVEKAKGHLEIAYQLLSSMQNEWLECVTDLDLDGSGRFREVDAYPLAQYARRNWDLHLQQLQDESLWQLIDSNPSFFSDSSAVRDNWLRASSMLGPKEDFNLFQVACVFGLLSLVKKVLKRKKLTSPFTFQRYINQQHSGSSPLCLAIRGGNTKLVQLLLSYKANIELPCVGYSKNSALHYATKRGHLEIFQLFAETKSGQRIIDADIKASQRGVEFDSLLHLAASSGDSQVCRSLIERYHYNVDVVGAWGQTPICNAISRRSIGLARILIEQWGASIAATDKILEAAVESQKFLSTYGSGDELDFVVTECKIDINTRDKSGETILHFAFHRMAAAWYHPPTYYEFAAHCVLLGADPSLRSTNGDAPFHLYKWFSSETISSLRPIISLVRDGRLGVNDKDSMGLTLLHKFIYDAFVRSKFAKNDIFIGLTSLLNVGADRTLVNSLGVTALQLARAFRDAIVAKLPSKGEHSIETLAVIVDVLENYATVSNQPQRLDPLDWPI